MNLALLNLTRFLKWILVSKQNEINVTQFDEIFEIFWNQNKMKLTLLNLTRFLKWILSKSDDSELRHDTHLLRT